MNGYLSHELHRCIEVKGKYVLLVGWKSLEAHQVQKISAVSGVEKTSSRFYDPFPEVEHFGTGRTQYLT